MSLFGHNVQMTFLQLSPSQLSRLFLVNLRPPQCLAKPPKWAYEFYLFWFLTKLRIDVFYVYIEHQMKVYFNHQRLSEIAEIYTFWIFIVDDGNYEQKKTSPTSQGRRKIQMLADF